ncbi:MAG: non-ribosomal peptide synthetase [Algicola sp.]|nr:non-ribosomal peptide synthetase [Algicola sp.]
MLQTHQTITSLVQGQQQSGHIDRPLRTLQFARTGFDVSVQEIFTAWHTGGTLVLISDEDKQDLVILPTLLDRLSIERLFISPAVLHWLVDELLSQQIQLTPLKQIICAGDELVLTPALNRFFGERPDCQLWNHYGPTETHVVTTFLAAGNEAKMAEKTSPIGQPIANINAYVLDEHLNFVPTGVVGELLISGAGVARGYLNQPELTADKFIANPFEQDSQGHQWLYKTGDLVRWLPDQQLAFLGRIDQQVKIRGFRIELGEIENSLASHGNVKDVVVMARNAASGDKQLVAYLVTDADENEDSADAHQACIAQLREYLEGRLPAYMVPAAFVLLDQLPLTANGKIDRKALPEPDVADQQIAYVPPQSEMECQLCEIWQELLGVERVGITDNFFRLGGHSLLATRLMSKINVLFSITLTFQEIFGAPVVKKISEIIEHRMINGIECDQQRVYKLNQDEEYDVEEFDL